MTTMHIPLNDSPALLMADLGARRRRMDAKPANTPTVTPPAGFRLPLDAAKDPRFVGPCLRTGADRHVWAEAVWTPKDGVIYGHTDDVTLHPAHDSDEYLRWMDRLDDLLDAAELKAAKCTVPGCVEDRGPLHRVEDMHTSQVEWLCADDMAFGGLASMNYTFDAGHVGVYLELNPEPMVGSLDDLAAFADALVDVAAQLRAKAQTSPFSLPRA